MKRFSINRTVLLALPVFFLIIGFAGAADEEWSGDGTNVWNTSPAGKVGVGTSGIPAANLEIKQSAEFTEGTKLRIANTNAANWSNGGVSTAIEFVKENTVNPTTLVKVL